MKNIVFVYRKKVKGRYSLENVFNSLIPYLKKEYNIKIYSTGGWKFFIKDFFYLRFINADIYHVIGDINYFSIFLPKNKTILTIPDIGHYIYDLKHIKKFLYKWFWIKFPIYCSYKITTISKFSKSKIYNLIDRKKYKVEVISACYRKDLKYYKKKFDRKNAKILFIGTGNNKNLKSLIRSAQFKKWTINIIGSLSPSDKILLDSFKINYSNFKNLNFRHIINAYRDNDLLCFVSLHEGFGLPVIEANATGTPVVASNIEPIKSVAGKSACLVNPRSIKNITEGIIKVINNKKFRQKLVLNGLKNSKNYHPCVIAKQYSKIYKTFL
jgi:glycosyltransferase involved in cell wall biosynthesis